MPINISATYTDMINLDSFIIDLNNLEAARVEVDLLTGEPSYGLLFMKTGRVHTVSITTFNKLKDYCRQEW